MYNSDYYIEPKYKKKTGITPDEIERNERRLKHFDKAAKRFATSDKEELARQQQQALAARERAGPSSTRTTSLADTSDGEASDVETLGAETISGETLDGQASSAEAPRGETTDRRPLQSQDQDEELPTYDTVRSQPGEELPLYSDQRQARSMERGSLPPVIMYWLLTFPGNECV